MDLRGDNVIFPLITTVFAVVVYIGLFLLFVKKLDKPTFEGKNIYSWFIVVGVVMCAATFIFTYLKGNYILFGLLMPYISFFVFCDILIQKTYDFLNYVFSVLAVIILLVMGVPFKENVIIFAMALLFIVLGYARAYGSSDGYLLFVSTLLLAGCGCKVFVYPFILLILSAFYSVVCIHLPVYVYKKIRKQEVNFWKARNAFGPAIYLSLMTVMVLDLLKITL